MRSPAGQTTQGCDEQMLKPEMPMNNEKTFASREKYWSEISIEEKIERLRKLLKSLVSMVDNQTRDNAETKSFIWDHAHEANGEVVLKVKKNEQYKLADHSLVGGVLGNLRQQASGPETDEVYI